MVVNRRGIDNINVEDLVSSIIAKTMINGLLMGSQSCIFKTPTILCLQNEKAYIPDAFSIGPLHHSNQNLKATENIKYKYLRGLLSRSPFPKARLRKIINSFIVMEKEIRECYADPNSFSSAEFVKIMLVDGCFIIELFRKNAFKQLQEKDDPVFTKSGMFRLLYHDLILLENQIPWMVLEHLFYMTLDSVDEMPLIQLATKFFGVIFPSTRPPEICPIEDIKHILDLIRQWLASSTKGKEESSMEWEPMPSAARLETVGIEIKKGSSESILDIKFKDGVLEIPRIVIHDLTETIFRNLISFEQCYPNCEARFTSYAMLMDNFISNAEDMSILCENDIIYNRMSLEDAVQFFNKLNHNAFVKNYHYVSLCDEVNAYSNRSWPRWRAVLVQNHFSNPWAAISTVAGAILLIVSVLQAWYTMP